MKLKLIVKVLKIGIDHLLTQFFPVFLANKTAESCVLLIFKTSSNDSSLQLDNSSPDISSESDTINNPDLRLVILGYTQFRYFNDNYFRLCHYLIHSVYDLNALDSENFTLKEYIFDLNDFKFQSNDYWSNNSRWIEYTKKNQIMRGWITYEN